MSAQARELLRQIIDRLQDEDVALKLTHGEGVAYYAMLDDTLHHHHREHESAESAEPGDDSWDRLLVDAQFLPIFEPDIVPLSKTPLHEGEIDG
jgi:hypothetical protein